MRVSFENIPALRFRAIRARIRAQADEMRSSGNAGSATSNGVTVEWNYDEAAESLVFTCTKRPWWISELMAASRIRDLVEAVE
jgi:hypothetical protein